MQSESAQVVLFLADISGYTPFMLSHAKAPVHGQMIIGELMETLMREVDRPLEVVELEGDALFMSASRATDPEAWQRRSRHLSDRVLRLFRVFDQRRAKLAAYSICRCGACANLKELRLKIVAHSGEALRSEVGGFTVLSGVDVITVHRLLKNSLDSNQCLLMTDSAYADLILPEGAEVVEGLEEYDVGSLKTFAFYPQPEAIGEDSLRGSFTQDDVALKILRHEIQQESASRHGASTSTWVAPGPQLLREVDHDVQLALPGDLRRGAEDVEDRTVRNHVVGAEEPEGPGRAHDPRGGEHPPRAAEVQAASVGRARPVDPSGHLRRGDA